jgi:excisionase family DNA binding protein
VAVHTSRPSEARAVTPSERLMTPAQVADFLAVPLGTVYRWRYEHIGPTGVRVGRHVRYRRSEIERWLDAGGSQCPTTESD